MSEGGAVSLTRNQQVLLDRCRPVWRREDAKAALKRAECPIAIKDKRGSRVTTLCF
jgi:hypothetical protein